MPRKSANKSEEATANNMALLYSNKIKKRLCTIEDVPEALRETVEALLAGGE